MTILGISAFYHDAAAAIVRDGKIVAAAQEERFSRKKHDASFPAEAVRYCLQEASVDINELDGLAFYDKPLLKFERLLETYYNYAPRGISSFVQSMPVWLKEKLFLKQTIKEEMKALGRNEKLHLLFPEHHLSHAASAFYPSPFESAAILTIDGVGEWATASICHGQGSGIKMLKEMRFPHSLGLFYSAFTYYLGFRVNSGEYKMMGLAPYGVDGEEVVRFRERLESEVITIYEDGSVWLNQTYFQYATGLRMLRDKKVQQLLGVGRREPETEIAQVYCNLALAVQQITESAVLKMAKHAAEITGERQLCLAGGVALNSVANGKLQNRDLFDSLFIQPASGDAGGALGAALVASHVAHGQARVLAHPDAMKGAYLGPRVAEKEVDRLLVKYGAVAHHMDDAQALNERVAKLLADAKIVGWVQGRMEYGPRALGNRSIIADPRSPEMQKRLNLKIKFRESFRPFAPAVLAEDAGQFFDLASDSPYMLLVQPVRQRQHKSIPVDYQALELREKLYVERSTVPAVTHVDFSARIQTVTRETNPRFHQLLSQFKKQTGIGMLINTSFNVRGEPIVRTADDAYRCFLRTEMDVLVINDHLFLREEQPKLDGEVTELKTYVMD